MPLGSWGETPTLAYLSSLLAGLAVLLAIRRPGGRWRSVHPASIPTWVRAVARWSAGRPDAPTLPRRLLLAGVAAAGLCGSTAATGSGPGAVVWWSWPVLTFGGGVLLGWLEPLAARRRRQRLVLEAPQALELLSACLAAGMPVRGANRALVASFEGPVAEDLGRVQTLTGLGVADSEAWRTLRDHPQFGPAAHDLARSVESGTMLVESLRQHAAGARAARQAALQVRARAVGVRSVLPLMACFIPSFLLLGVVPTVVSAVGHAFR